MTKVIMHGCNGKMGQVITGLIAQDEDVKIVAGIDTYDEKKNDYPVYKTIRECQIAADVVIDFSNAKAVDELLNYCGEKKLRWYFAPPVYPKTSWRKLLRPAKRLQF